MCSGLFFPLTLKKTSTNLSQNVYKPGGYNSRDSSQANKDSVGALSCIFHSNRGHGAPQKCWAEGLSGSWQAWGGTISAVGWSDIALSFDFQNYFYESNSKKLAR